MLNRIKKKVKKEKGFTLVELLAVIAILGIVTAIAVPTIGNVIGDSETEAHEANVELIENAAQLAAVSGEDESEESDSDSTIYTVGDLVDAGYLEDIPDDAGDYTYEESHSVTVTDSQAVYEEYRDDSGGNSDGDDD